MILSFEDLPRFRGAVTMVDGAFDPLHPGHLAYFAAAAELGAPVLCNLAADAYVRGKHPVFLPQAERARLIAGLRSIDHVHVNPHDTETVLETLRPRHYVKGADWKGRLPPRQVEICAEHGIEIVWLDTVLDSSSAVLNRYMERAGVPTGAGLDAYEKFVLEQSGTGADDYDASYFNDTWRAEDNAYTVEARRPIEGRNPRLIKEVFAPERVLDMGCGPGALMYLLHEIGVKADGVDLSEASKELAPPEVAGGIHIGSVTEVDLPTDSYDLVICREVFEHLTVLQVQKAVENICRISSRFVYVTTRFHPAPTSLFDVTTEFDVDPTHITCMNQDMLRLMFVLQGFGRRRDLEAGMDWLNKRRVLVYEKRPKAG